MSVIELDEDIGVKKIKDFYLQLKSEINKETEPEIVLDFSRVRRVDLSLIQVLMAVDKELGKRGRKIMLKSVSGDIKKQLYLSRLFK